MATTFVPVQLSGLGSTAAQYLPVKSTNSNVGLQVVISGTGTYNVQISMYDPAWVNRQIYQEAVYNTLFPTGVYDNDAQWQNHNNLQNLTASQIGNLIIPCAAIRLNCSAYTSGYGILIIQPAAYPG